MNATAASLLGLLDLSGGELTGGELVRLATGDRLELLTTGVAGNGGWVDVKEPIIVRAGDTFVAVPCETDT